MYPSTSSLYDDWSGFEHSSSWETDISTFRIDEEWPETHFTLGLSWSHSVDSVLGVVMNRDDCSRVGSRTQ